MEGSISKNRYFWSGFGLAGLGFPLFSPLIPLKSLETQIETGQVQFKNVDEFSMAFIICDSSHKARTHKAEK
jgi:hypothetical protein